MSDEPIGFEIDWDKWATDPDNGVGWHDGVLVPATQPAPDLTHMRTKQGASTMTAQDLKVGDTFRGNGGHKQVTDITEITINDYDFDRTFPAFRITSTMTNGRTGDVEILTPNTTIEII